MNYFELFEIEPTPAVADHTYVAKKYKALQKKYHPDFYTDADEMEKEEMLRKSAAVNEGYNVFRNKQKLIEYFLREKGVITEDEKFALPPDFLMGMMEINEAISDGDEADAQQQVKTFEDSLTDDIKGILEKIPAEISPAELEKMKEYYYKTKYLKRVLDRI